MNSKKPVSGAAVTSRSHATGLFVSGFQSLVRPTFIPIRPLTFLYGPNSAGKSAVIDAINLFRAFARRGQSKWGQVAKWKPISSAELVHQRARRPWEDGWMAIGAQYVVGNDFMDELSKEVKEARTILGESTHLDWLNQLIGRTVQIEINAESHLFDVGIRIAVDHEPVLEYSPFGTSGMAVDRDGHFRRSDHPHFDNSEVLEDDFDAGRLALHWRHKFWKRDRRVDTLKQYTRSGDVGAISEFICQTDRALEISDVGSNYPHVETDQTLELHSGKLLRLALSSDRNVRKVVMAWGGSDTFKRASISRLIDTPEASRIRVGNAIDSLLEDLGPFCWALLELGAVSLEHCHVSGDRSVIRPSATAFVEGRGSHYRFNEEIRNFEHQGSLDATSQPASAYFEALAAALAAAESRKARKLVRVYEKPSVNEWLRDLLPSMRHVQIRADAYRVSALNEDRGPVGGWSVGPYALRLYVVDGQQRPHEFEDVGSGLSYVFPILVALWARRFAIVEQPELHLHPAAQCEMADVFIAAKNQGHVAIVESHSEHMLLRVLRRVRETTSKTLRNRKLAVSPDDVAVMYFDPQPDGTTTLKHLRVSRVGDFIDRWPNGFFEERVKELFGE